MRYGPQSERPCLRPLVRRAAFCILLHNDTRPAGAGHKIPSEDTPMTRFTLSRRALLASGAGMAGILAAGRAPAIAQTQPKKLVFAHINAAPESAAINFEWMAKEGNARSKGALDMQFFGKTLIPQELEVMNAVKSGSIAIGSPSGAAATVFPEMGAFLVPYLVKDYAHAYAMFNGRIGDRLDKEIQDKYKLKVL